MDVIAAKNGHQRCTSEPGREIGEKQRTTRRFSQPTQQFVIDPSSSKVGRILTDVSHNKDDSAAEGMTLFPIRLHRRRTHSSSSLIQHTCVRQNVRARSVGANSIATETPERFVRLEFIQKPNESNKQIASTSRLSDRQDEDDSIKDTNILEPSISNDAALLQFAYSPPKRSLRQRKPAQLAPYTTEMARYKRRLVRNDWEDAVVVSRELMRAARVERMNAKEGPVDLPEENSRSRQSNAKERRWSSNKSTENSIKKSRKSLIPIDQNRINQRLERNSDLAETHDEVNPDFSATPTTDSQSIPTPLKDVSESKMAMLKRKRFRILSESDESEDLGTKDIVHDTIEDDDVEEVRQHNEMPVGIDIDDAGSSISAVSWSNDRQQRNSKLRDRDYDSLLRMLRKTMPARMAREYIEDLKAMDREIQLLPNDEGGQNDNLSLGDANDDLTQELLPGQSKKRQRKGSDLRNERFKLIGDSENETESSASSAISAVSDLSRSSVASSQTKISRDYELLSVDGDVNIRKRRHRSVLTNGSRSRKARNSNEGTSKRSAALYGNDDAIDRMLCSSRGIHKKRQTRDRPPGSVDKGRRTKPSTSRTSENQMSKDTSFKKKRREGGKVTDKIGRSASNPFGNANSLSYIPEARPYGKRQGLRPILQDADLFLPYDSALERKIALDKATLGSAPPKRAVEAWIADVDSSREPEQMTPVRTPSHARTYGQTSAPNSHDRKVGQNEFKSKQHFLGHSTDGAQVKLHSARKGLSPATPTTDIEQQRTEAEIWSSVGLVRLDFDISPPDIGIRCNPEGYLGRGRLFSLLHSSDCGSHFDFHVESDCPDTEDTWQRILSTVQRSSLSEKSIHTSLLHCLDDICEQYAIFAKSSAGSDRMQQILDAVDQLISLARREDQLKGIRDAQSTILSKLQWYKVELLYRTIVEDSLIGLSLKDAFLQSCQDLMITLLVHGLHRTMSSMKHAKPRESQDAGSIHSINDWSLESWVCLIHVLQSNVAKEMDTSTSNTPFWNVFKASLKIYHNALRDAKTPFVVAENAWYSIFAICAISRVSPTTGSCTTHSALQKPCWSLVLQAISMVKLRFEERIEALMSKTAIRARDQYIHLVLRRILVLTHKWKWPLENVEQLLTKIFSIFNANRLQDLPSESHHDFPHSLREFDMQILYSDTIFGDETAFQIFLRILAVAVDRARHSSRSDRQGMDRLASRILSRFSPMRTLQFASDNVPTFLERSALFNHYSIALLYLFFVPSSEQQRLLQVQQYLNVAKADQKSQMVGVRAVMYAAIILRHHDRPINAAMTWFKRLFIHMIDSFQHLHSKLASVDHSSKSSIHRELASRKTVLLACLRAVHYILQKNSIDSSNTRTSAADTTLLNPAWTNDLYDNFYLIHYPQIVFESLRLISSHFTAISPKRKGSDEQNAKSNNSESQESYSELFEDLDFDNAALLQIAGYGPEEGQVTPAVDDRALAQHDTTDADMYEQLSSALFRTINIIGKPENASSFGFHQFGQAEDSQLLDTDAGEGEYKAQIGKLAIVCWAKCAMLLVERYAVRSWDFYFRFGKEAIRSSLHINTRHTLSMHFFIALLQESSELSSASRRASHTFGEKEDVYLSNLTEIWTCALISVLEIQDVKATSTFIQLTDQFEKERRLNFVEDDCNSMPFDLGDEHDESLVKAMLQSEKRFEFLSNTIASLSAVAQQRPNMQKVVINTFIAIFSFIRQFISQNLKLIVQDHKGNRLKGYLQFLNSCHRSFDQALARALAIDLRNTQAVVQQHLDQVPQNIM